MQRHILTLLLSIAVVSANACGTENPPASTTSSSGGTGGASSTSSSGSTSGNGGSGGASSSSGSSSSGTGGGSSADSCPADGSENAYYLSPTGSDNAPGSFAAPWQSFSFALKALKAGDTLCVHGGTYKERAQVGVVSPGTSNAPVRVLTIAGERPIIQGLLWIKGSDDWHFHGINVTWDSANAHDEHMVKFTDGKIGNMPTRKSGAPNRLPAFWSPEFPPLGLCAACMSTIPRISTSRDTRSTKTI